MKKSFKHIQKKNLLQVVPKICFLESNDAHSKRTYYINYPSNYLSLSLSLLGAASTLVHKSIERMVADECDEVVLETEVTNTAALALYENLGFVRDKYLHQYYLNGEDAYRLKLWLTDTLLE